MFMNYPDDLITLDLYHGTSEPNAKSIVNSRTWNITLDKYWLGTGVYFMQDSYSWACSWAIKGKYRISEEEACYIRVEFSTKRRNILDLIDVEQMDAFLGFMKIFDKDATDDASNWDIISTGLLDKFCEYIELGKFDGFEKSDIHAIRGFFRMGSHNTREKCPIRGQIQVVVKESVVSMISIIDFRRCVQ